MPKINDKSWISWTFILVLSSSSQVNSAPFSIPQHSSSCGSTTCFKSGVSSSSLNKLNNYEEGKSYVYNYESKLETKLKKTTDDSSITNIKTTAIITAVSSCDFVLTLQNVEISSPNGQRVVQASTKLDGSSVRFTFQNGQIEEFCTTESDPNWSANIKRSIVSMLQNTATNSFGDSTVMEVDISGRCPTEYKMSGDKYTKTRNLTACSYRNGGELISKGVPYSVASEINSDPILKSKLSCDQIISDGIMKSVECSETHQLEPLISLSSDSYDSSILKSFITTNLTLMSIDEQSPIPDSKIESINIPSSILFDHSDSTPSQTLKTDSSSNTLKLVQELCSELGSGTVSSNVPGLYLSLGKSMKYTTLSELENIYSRIQNNDDDESSSNICSSDIQPKLKKLYINVAARVGSSDSIEFVINRILNGEVDKSTLALFNHHTSFASKPAASTLTAMNKLISSPFSSDSNVILASTALAYEYCTQTNMDCISNPEYITLTSAVAEIVSQNCQSQNIDSMQKSLVGLQALGNLNHLPRSAVNALTTCLESEDTSSRVKIQALGAFRRDPCVANLKEAALDMFQDTSVSSELRIHGYLAAIRCLNQNDVEMLQKILDAEESNQVGSFVSTHIQAQLQNEAPNSRALKKIFKQLSFSSKSFPFDPRRFSTHFAFSKFDATNNLGISTDSDLIYSQDHFLPKSLQANLTGYFFGRAYNLLEFGIHSENFEHLFEKYFGPASGVSSPPQKSGSSSPSANSITKETDHQRVERSIQSQSTSEEYLKSLVNQNDLQTLHSQAGSKIKSKFPSFDGSLDFYVRELGTSVYTNSFSQSDLIRLIPTKISTKEIYLAIYEKIIGGSVNSATKDFKIDLTQPTVFIDEEVIFSTISGLPLRLNLQGSTVSSLKLDGNIDLPAIIRNTNNNNEGINFNNVLTEFKSKIIPSAATIITGSMRFGSESFIESGLRLEAKLHSSVPIDIDLTRQEGKFEFKFNLPSEKLQLVELSSELFWTQQVENEIEIKTALNSKWDSPSSKIIDNQCINTFSKILGLKLCGNVALAGHGMSKAPFFPLAGKSIISFAIEKTESSMEGYYFKAESFLQGTSDQKLSIIFDTSGSITNRKITAKGDLKQTDEATVFGLDIVSPWKNARIDYNLWNKNDLKGIELRFGSDASIYTGTAQYKQSKLNEIDILYEPSITYSFPGAEYTLLEGQVKRLSNGIELNLSSAGQTKAFQGKINGLIQLEQQPGTHNRLFKLTGLQLENAALGKIHTNGDLSLKPSSTALNLKTTYGSNLENNLNFKLDNSETIVKKSESESINTKLFESKLSSTHNPALNFEILFTRVITGGDTFDHKFVIQQGLHEATKFKLSQESKYYWKSKTDHILKNQIEIDYPIYGIDFLMSIDSTNTKTRQYHDFLIESGSLVKAQLKYDAPGGEVKDDNYDLTGSLSYPGQTIKFSEIAKKVSSEKWTYKTQFESTPQGRSSFTIEADTEFTYKNDQRDQKSEILTSISSSALEDLYTFHSKFLGHREAYTASLSLAKPDYDLLNFHTEYKQALGNKPNLFSTKAFIINYIDGSLTETHDRTSSNFQFDFNWIPTGRKILGSSELKRIAVNADLYSFDGNIAWDAEKDPTQSASVTSRTIYKGRNGYFIDSNNTFTIQTLSREFHIKGKLPNDISNGESGLESTFTNYEGLQYGFILKSVNENKVKVKGQNLIFKLIWPDEEPFELIWNNRLSNMDLRNYLFEFVSELNLHYNGSQAVLLQTELHSVLTNKWSISGLLEASGSTIPDKMRFDFNTILQTGKIETGFSSVYHGSTSEFTTQIDFDVISAKKVLEYKYNLKTPYTSLKSIDGGGKYGYLFNSWTNFEIYETGIVVLNGNAPNSWDISASFLQNDFKGKYSLVSEGVSLLALNLNGKSTSKKISGVLKNKIRSGSETEFIFDCDRPYSSVANPGLALKLNIKTNKASIGLLSYRFNIKSSNNGEMIETSFRGRSSSDRLAFASKIENSPLRKSIDIITSSDKSFTRKLYFLVNGPIDNKFNVETLVRWGDEGKTISSSGSILRSENNIDGSFSFDSPYFNADKWIVKVAKEKDTVTGKYGISLTAQSAQQDMAVILLDYSQKQDKPDHSTHYNGSISVKAYTLDFIGTFHTIDKHISLKTEQGRQIKTTFELSSNKFPVMFEVFAKNTNLEDVASFSFCNVDDAQNCKISKLIRQKFNSATKKGSTTSLSSQTITNGVKSAYDSLVVTAVGESSINRDGGSSFEQSLKYIAIDSQELGYKIYSMRHDIYSQDVDYGFEIDLPTKRQISTLFNRKFNASSTTISLESWFDKLRRPDDKLTITINSKELGNTMIARAGNEKMSFTGQELSLIIQHPTLSKDLLVKATTTSKYNDNIWTRSNELILDVFKPNHELIISFDSSRDLSYEDITAYELDFNVKSVGQGISLEIHSEIRATPDREFTSNSKLSYLNREGKERLYGLDFDYGYNRRTFLLGGPNGRILSYSSNYYYQIIPGTNTFDGYDVRREIYLPGMADTRIFQNKVSFSFPPKVDIKMYTISSPPGQYQQFQFGFKNEQEFIASLSEYEASSIDGGQKNLIDFEVALNGSRLLFVKTDWNKENIKRFLTKGQVRLHDTSSRFKIMTQESGKLLFSELEYISSQMNAALPPFSPLVESYKKELIDLKVEVESAENIETLGHYLEFAFNIFGTDSNSIKQYLISMSTYTTSLLRSGLDYLTITFPSRFQTLLPSVMSSINYGFTNSLEVFVQTYNLTIKNILQTIERISASNAFNFNNSYWTSFKDSNTGFGELWAKALLQSFEFASTSWNTLKSNTQVLFETEYMQNLRQQLTNKYEDLMANAIEESKTYVESVRDSILVSLPAQEQFQLLLQKLIEYVELTRENYSNGNINDVENDSVDRTSELQNEIYEAFISLAQELSLKLFTIDLKNGLFIAHIPLPTPVKSLTDIDSLFESIPSTSSLSWPKIPTYNFYNNNPLGSLQSVFGSSFLMGLKNGSSSLQELIPPFEGYGLVIGSKFYRTFDGKFYQFEGNCQYVLASDFVDKNFTVMINYKKSTEEPGEGEKLQKSIVITDHKNVFSIESDLSVLLNGKQAHIPSTLNHIKLSRNQNWINIIDSRGFEVSCSTHKDLCLVRLNGFYQGKTNGLLGTFNNEHFDDLKMNSSGDISESQFANSWKLDKQCQEEDMSMVTRSESTITRNVQAIQKCYEIFQLRSSPLSSCFDTIDPSNYENICNLLSKEDNLYDSTRSICTAATSYQLVCKMVRIPIQLGSICQYQP